MNNHSSKRPAGRRIARQAVTATVLGAAMVLSGVTAHAEDKAAGNQQMYLKEVAVIGSKEAVKDIAGSAYFVDTKEIQERNLADINRILRKVPGVSVRQEDGFGLFPNISLRGVDPGRSQKVTIMEDGIITAPAPYSAPGAYYSPNPARMQSIEILKGSTTVRYGPHITGGVINYNSTAIPDAEMYFSKTSFGSFNEIRNHTYFGNTVGTSIGNVGFVVENFHRENDGFRRTHVTQNNLQEQDTGLRMSEQMFKVMWEPKSSMYQRFEIKLGHTNMQFNDGYLGQTQAQFRADPYARFDAGRFDQMGTEHFRTYIRHMIEFNSDTKLVTTGYGNHFSRDWNKLHNCNNINGVATDDPDLPECMSRADGVQLLSGLAGTSGRLDVRHNNRNYYLYGVQSQLDHHLTLGPTTHDITAGVRYHVDQIRRFQHEEELTVDAGGNVTDLLIQAGGAAGNRLQNTKAIAVNLEDAIKFGRFTFKPGVRFEQVFAEFVNAPNMMPAPNRGYDDYSIWAGGGSLNYNIVEDSRHRADVFAGVIRGFSPPSPGSRINDNLVPETSLGTEVGARYHNNELAFQTELIFFHTDFDNLIVPDSIAAGGATSSESAGEVRSQGIEFQVRYDPGQHQRWSFNVPTYFSLTYTDAEIVSATTTATLDDDFAIFAGAVPGNQVAYIPEVQFAFGTGIEYGPFAFYIDGQYQDATFASGNNSPLEIDPINGRADSRFGMTDSFLLLDATANYQVHKNVKLFTTFQNILDDQYIVTRVPNGVRGGRPFSMLGGVEISIF
ncbi:MAG: TonB-dependent receptor [Nitrospina sp.]|nr:TonB-dependent receptor [Nitrospina sp.]